MTWTILGIRMTLDTSILVSWNYPFWIVNCKFEPYLSGIQLVVGTWLWAMADGEVNEEKPTKMGAKTLARCWGTNKTCRSSAPKIEHETHRWIRNLWSTCRNMAGTCCSWLTQSFLHSKETKGLSSDRESSPEGQKLQETPCFGGNYHAFNRRLWHPQFIALNASPTFLAEGVVSEVLALAMAQCANALPAHSLLAFSAFFALPEAQGSCWDALWKKVNTRSFWRQGVEKATQKRLYKPWDLRRFKHW